MWWHPDSPLLKSVKFRINFQWKESHWAQSTWIRPWVEAIHLTTTGQRYKLRNASLALYCSGFPVFTLCRAGSKGLGFIEAQAHFFHHLGTSPFQHLGTNHTAIGAWSSGGRKSYSVPGLVIPKLHVHNPCGFGLKKMKLTLMKTALKTGQTLQVAAG